MDEADFWGSLEYRICHEFAGMRNFDLRHLWCDGFTPERYSLDGSEPRIVGRAWICYGQRQAEWKFTLFLPVPVKSREDIDWQALLPPANMTKWLALDQDAKRIEIEPSAAVPDPE
jgi:hypothetical protein